MFFQSVDIGNLARVVTDVFLANNSVAKSNLHYKLVDDEADRIVTRILSIGEYRQSRPSCFSPGNKFLSFFDVKAVSQLNSDNLRNAGQALVVHNSLDILLAH